MKVLLLLAMVGLSYGQLAPECIQGEFANDGYTTGQNIELNYQGTQMQMGGNGKTQIQVGFLVPKVYSEMYDASGMSISFNREQKQGAPGIDPTYTQLTTNANACFTNRVGTNDTACPLLGTNPSVWRNDGAAAGDSPCVDYMYMTIDWEDAITNEAFSPVQYVEDGESTRVYITATVETWRKFHETSGANYQGQMTGSQQLNTGGSATDRTGTFWGDAGDLGVNFDPLEMNDWRYTLYQIPFYLKFPKTTVVTTDFTVGSPIAVLKAVVQQDTIQVNFNPSEVNPGPEFAQLDVTVRTQVQYPYAIRGPDDATAGMNVYVGSDNTGSGTHAASITPRTWDHPATCGGNQPGQICQQEFTFRIVPLASQPCTVAGDYYMEFWAVCTNGNPGGLNACVLDDKVDSTVIATQRTSTAFFDLKFTVDHQSFCPEVVDTVHVAVDLKAYHDESFSTEISNLYDGTATSYTGNNEHIVYTNDIIFYEATYRTGSEKSTQSAAGTNNQDTPGGPDFIDYVRAIKIFADMTLGVSSQGAAVNAWARPDWKANLIWTLGGSRIPGPGEDFDDAALTVTGTRVLTVPASQPSDRASWTMILCEVDYISAEVPIMTGVKPADCFTASTDIAKDFMDFNKVMSSLAGSANTIDENEIAFKMRMDERVFPVGPATDNSFVTITVESEVYYKGNKHPSRRLLQSNAGSTAALRKQKHSKSMIHSISYKPSTLEVCDLDENLDSTTLELELDFHSNRAPELSTVNNWALGLAGQMEVHMDVQNSFKITNVKHCDQKGCAVLLESIKSTRRRAQSKNIVYITVEITSPSFNTAGRLANTLQKDIVDQTFTVKGAQIKSMDAKDCGVVSKKSSKLASSSAALGLMFSGFVGLCAAAL